jgi:hypothetical protein
MVKVPQEAYLAVTSPTRLTLAELRGRISTRHTLAGLCGGISPVGLQNEPHKTQRLTLAGLPGRISTRLTLIG